jgi:hypothetical protein
MADEDEVDEEEISGDELMDDDDDLEPFVYKTPVVFVLGLLLPPLGLIVSRKKESWTQAVQLAATLTALLGFGGWCIPPVAYSVNSVLEVGARFRQMEQALGFAGGDDESGARSEDGELPDALRITGACISDTGGILSTQRFLASLDRLMKDHQPLFTDEGSQTYPCVTKTRLKLDPEVRSLSRLIRIARNKSDRMLAQRKFEYADSGFHKQYTFSTDLASINGPTTYACYYYDTLKNKKTSFFGQEYETCQAIAKRRQKKGHPETARWAVLEKGPLYKQGEMPELMKRMMEAKVELPTSISCLVSSSEPNGVVHCRGQNNFKYGLKLITSTLKEKEEFISVQNGDVIQIRRDAEDESEESLISEIRKRDRDAMWMVGVFDVKHVYVEERSACCDSL